MTIATQTRAATFAGAALTIAAAIALNASDWAGLLAFLGMGLAVLAWRMGPPETRTVAERRLDELNRNGWTLIWLVAVVVAVAFLAAR